jgi:ribosomal-protein-alanine N-acetyltransferase
MPGPPGWPATPTAPPVTLRPLRLRDGGAWTALRRTNVDWLAPWEATAPDPDAPPLSYRQMVRRLGAQARDGDAYPWALLVDGRLAGQVNVSGIIRGSALSAHIGYWIGEAFAGRGAMPLAVALAIDHCFGPGRLHRVEINIRPENRASLRVVEKLGLREEGVRARYLHIAGSWADHRSFAITAEEVGPGGMVARLAARS